jgi:hypothetical protein
MAIETSATQQSRRHRHNPENNNPIMASYRYQKALSDTELASLLEEETIIHEFDNILDSDDDSDHVFEEEELDDVIEENVEARNATIGEENVASSENSTEDTENNLEYSTRDANIRWSKVPIRNNRKRHSQANVLKIPPGTTTYSSQFDTFSEAFLFIFF